MKNSLQITLINSFILLKTLVTFYFCFCYELKSKNFNGKKADQPINSVSYLKFDISQVDLNKSFFIKALDQIFD